MRIYINPRDLIALEGRPGKVAAQSAYQYMRRVLAIKHPAKISVQVYAEYRGCNPDEVLKTLEAKKE